MSNQIEEVNQLFIRHQNMVKDHLEHNGVWDPVLHNMLVIQLQEAWPVLYQAWTEKK